LRKADKALAPALPPPRNCEPIGLGAPPPGADVTALPTGNKPVGMGMPDELAADAD